MNFIPVKDSSNIEAYGYDPKTQELGVKFQSGRQYVYSNVPHSAWTAFQAATSKGKHHEARIKPAFVGARVE